MKIDEPSFNGLLGGSPSEAVVDMHLASAAMRIPVMLQKTIEARPLAARDFGSLWKGDDWERNSMPAMFPKVKALGHCADGPLGVTRAELLQHALTIVTVLRDDFGHGEEGVGTREYKKQRKNVLDSVHACRIAEAETVLIRWAIDQLG